MNLAKKDKAVLDLEAAKDHLDRVAQDYELTLEAIDRQLAYLIDAKEAANASDDDVLENELNKINHSIDKEQLIFLTDKEARELREDAIREIVEGRI